MSVCYNDGQLTADLDKENRPRRKADIGKPLEGKLSDRLFSVGNNPNVCRSDSQGPDIDGDLRAYVAWFCGR